MAPAPARAAMPPSRSAGASKPASPKPAGISVGSLLGSLKAPRLPGEGQKERKTNHEANVGGLAGDVESGGGLGRSLTAQTGSAMPRLDPAIQMQTDRPSIIERILQIRTCCLAILSSRAF